MVSQYEGASKVEQLKVRRKFDPKDVNRVRNYLASRVQEARSQGDEVLELNVGKISLEAGLGGATGHAVCCNVLDSDRFARNHALWYHHRRGAWGTADAEYTFVLNVDAEREHTDRPSYSRWVIIRVLLWVAVLAVSAAVIWGVFMLALR